MIKKEEIFDLVRAYYKENFVHKDYIEGDYIQYGGILHDEKEMINIVDTALDFRLAGGNYHDTFEKKLAKFLNVKRITPIAMAATIKPIVSDVLYDPPCQYM